MQSSSTYFLFASVALLVAGGARSQTTPALIVEISDRVPRIGDEVVFTCILTGSPSSTLTMNKVIVDVEQKLVYEQIAINGDIVKPYKDMGRFTVIQSTEGGARKFVLTIAEVQLVDSGHYACGAPGVDNLYAMEIVEVYRKPQNVSFVGHSTNEVVVVYEGEKANLVCTVPEVLPIPSVQLLLERTSISPKDISEAFLLSAQLNTHCSGNAVGKTCPLHMSYTVLATNRDFIPSFVHDGKQLTCTAKMKQLEMDEMSSTVKLSVIYPPKFVCAGLWNGTVNMTDLRIICQVHANPPSGSANKSATIKAFGRIILVRSGENSPEYSLQDTPQVSTGQKVSQLEFVIKTVTEEHFTYTYYLHAFNEAGNTTKTITIEQTMTPLVDGADDGLRVINIFTVSVSIVFALVFGQL